MYLFHESQQIPVKGCIVVSCNQIPALSDRLTLKQRAVCMLCFDPRYNVQRGWAIVGNIKVQLDGYYSLGVWGISIAEEQAIKITEAYAKYWNGNQDDELEPRFMWLECDPSDESQDFYFDVEKIDLSEAPD